MEKHYIVYKVPKKLRDRRGELYAGEVHAAYGTEPEAAAKAQKLAFEMPGTSFTYLLVHKVFTAGEPVIIEKLLHEPEEVPVIPERADDDDDIPVGIDHAWAVGAAPLR